MELEHHDLSLSLRENACGLFCFSPLKRPVGDLRV
jgi:hypothetical protein